MADQVVSRQGDTLDALMWRERGLQAADLTAILDSNPGLAALGEELPAGTVVTVPDAVTAPASAPLPTIQLWD